MSAKKVTDTKIPEDENIDSGNCDLMSEEIEESGEIEAVSGDINLKSDSISDDKTELDSGLCELTESLSDVKLIDITLETPRPQPQQVLTHHRLESLYQQDKEGDTQLHIASIHGCEKSVAILVKILPEKICLDVPNDCGHTPLHLAVMSGNAIVTRILVRAGASIGIRDMTGETPLHKATKLCNKECMQALLTPVPDHPRPLSPVLNQRNYNGQACVHIAATLGHVEILQTLVYYGADINLTENLAGWTPLHIAARRGDVRLVQYLRERCPGVDMYAQDYAGRTPRRHARRTAAARLFRSTTDDSDSDSESEICCNYDSDPESLFDLLNTGYNPINVA